MRVIQEKKDNQQKELNDKTIQKKDYYKSNENKIPKPTTKDLYEENKISNKINACKSKV